MFYGYIYEETLWVKFEDVTSLSTFYADAVHIYPNCKWVLLTYKLDNLPEVEFGNLKMEEYQRMLKLAFQVNVFEHFC